MRRLWEPPSIVSARRNRAHAHQRHRVGRAHRIPRLLLALHVAGARGVLVADLIDRIPVSRSTLYRDITLLRAVGWRIDMTVEPGVDGPGRQTTVALAAWQRLPKAGDGPA